MQGFQPSSWQVQAELDLLRREAEALITGRGA
jgi:hypothetical protein